MRTLLRLHPRLPPNLTLKPSAQARWGTRHPQLSRRLLQHYLGARNRVAAGVGRHDHQQSKRCRRDNRRPIARRG